MGSPVRQIFLSYSRPDQDQVEQIAIRLDRAGYRVWFDQAKNLVRHEVTQARFQGQRVAKLVKELRETHEGDYRVVAHELDAVLEPGSYLPILIDQFEEALKPISRDDGSDGDARDRIAIYRNEQFVPFVQNLAFAPDQERPGVCDWWKRRLIEMQ